MKPLTHEWGQKAEGDYTAAETLRQAENPVYDAICFHAQQCVEKYLKAWLVQHEIDFPRTHDLEALAKQCLPSLPDLDALMDELRFLTSYALDIIANNQRDQKKWNSRPLSFILLLSTRGIDRLSSSRGRG